MQNSPRSYLQRAFSDQHNVILLVGSVVLSLAFASFLPALVGLVAEMLFLAICPRLRAFRDWADARDGEQHRLQTERLLGADIAALGSAHRLRFEAFSRLLDEVLARIASHHTLSFEAQQELREHFDLLLQSTLALLRAQQNAAAASSEIPAVELAQEVARLDRAFAAERDLELRMGLRQQSLAAQRRISQREELEKTRAKVELELATLEKSAGYLKSRAADSANAEHMLSEVRALLPDGAAPSSRLQPGAEPPPGSAAALSAPPGLMR